MFENINWLAVLVSTAVSMLLGYVWYSMPVFGRVWMGLIGKTEADLKNGRGPAMGGAVVLAFITSLALALVIDKASAFSMADGLKTALWVWFGFAFTTLAMNNLFALRPFRLTMITAGYHLVQFLIIGAILGAWL